MAVNLLMLSADNGVVAGLDDITQTHDVYGTFQASFVTGKFSANGSAYAHLRNVLQQVFVDSATTLAVLTITPITNDQEAPSAAVEVDIYPATDGTSYQMEIPFFRGGVDHQLHITVDVPARVQFGECEMWLVPRRQRNV